MSWEGLARGQGKCQGCSSIRGNQMNLGGPSAAGSADGLPAVFFNAPVPSGWTLTIVLYNATASIFTRMICACCHLVKTRSSTPLFAHRFMRV
jgi:hypothetical protein